MSSESKVITATSEVDIFHFDPAVKDLIEGDAAAKSYGEVCECHERIKLQCRVKLTRTALKAFFTSFYVILCSASAAIGGFLFGFDQGLISIVLGMPQFLESFPEIDGTVNSSAAFNKG